MMRSSSFLKPQKLSACCADDCGLPELGGRLADQRDKCVHGAHGVCVCKCVCVWWGGYGSIKRVKCVQDEAAQGACVCICACVSVCFVCVR
jgi:hypothetical protein